jgi:multiple sugar transport system substrate-binding protein
VFSSSRLGTVVIIAVNAGVEIGSQIGRPEWGAARGVKVEVVELPYANLFEKEQLDLTSRTGAYDVIMLDDPWFPKLVENGNLAALTHDPDGDFVGPCLDVCRNPYRTGRYYALPYVGNSQLFFYRKDLFEKHKLRRPRGTKSSCGEAISEGENVRYVMRGRRERRGRGFHAAVVGLRR